MDLESKVLLAIDVGDCTLAMAAGLTGSRLVFARSAVVPCATLAIAPSAMRSGEEEERDRERDRGASKQVKRLEEIQKMRLKG